MPNFATSAALVETATKCFATDVSSPPSAGQRPLARGAGVGHRLQRREGLGRHDEEGLRRIEIADRFGEVGAVDVRDEAEGQAAVAVVPERLVGHDRPEIGAADADVDDVADRLAGVALPGARRARGSRSPPSGRARHAPRARRSAPSTTIDAPRGARSATWSTARFSETLIFSPRNMASIRARRPRLLGEADEQRQRLVGDAVLRVVEVDARRLRRQPFAAPRIARRTARGDGPRGSADGALRAPSRPVAR